mmetsp:Transcript_19215/g.54294  ORF Transcript_19215/g.54294 Transcript_19215/m.54294 type:complete len:274 (-) Transcript_19215:294-1115(-)
MQRLVVAAQRLVGPPERAQCSGHWGVLRGHGPRLLPVLRTGGERQPQALDGRSWRAPPEVHGTQQVQEIPHLPRHRSEALRQDYRPFALLHGLLVLPGAEVAPRFRVELGRHAPPHGLEPGQHPQLALHVYPKGGLAVLLEHAGRAGVDLEAAGETRLARRHAHRQDFLRGDLVHWFRSTVGVRRVPSLGPPVPAGAGRRDARGRPRAARREPADVALRPAGHPGGGPGPQRLHRRLEANGLVMDFEAHAEHDVHAVLARQAGRHGDGARRLT